MRRPPDTAELRDALLSVTSAARVEPYYLGVALRFARALDPAGMPRIVGISGPQGSGKSTLASALAKAFIACGVETRTLSIDDFYLTRAEQLAVAAQHQGNPCFEHRGYPGTHDVSLGARVLEELANGRPTRLPRYDKSAHGGRGDRAPASSWVAIEGPVPLVIFEGWMLGFRSLPDDPGLRALRAPNDALASYAAWDVMVELVLLEAADPSFIVAWRVDAERARRDRGEAALGDADARDYIERFLPAYDAWVPPLARRIDAERGLHIRLGADRMPLRGP